MMVSFADPLFMTLLPFVAIALFLLLFFKLPSSPATWKRRLLLSVGFTLLVSFIFVALAQPYIVLERPLSQTPQVHVIFDDSASMTMYDVTQDMVEEQLDGHVPYVMHTIGDESSTPLLRSLLSQLRYRSQILVVSDGQDTYEDLSYRDVLEQAQRQRATIHKVTLTSQRDEQSVYLVGPQTSIAGVENTYLVGVGGEGPYEYVEVLLDGQTIFTAQPGEPKEFTHTFTQEDTYVFEARIHTQRDFIPDNNVFYKTTRIVPKPPVLYVGSDPDTHEFLTQFTNVTQVNSIPSDLSAFTAVIVQNKQAASLGDIEALEQFVAEGNGLFVMGGSNAFEFSNYDGSALSPLLPVQSGRSGDVDRGAVVLVIDVSASAGSTAFGDFGHLNIAEFTQLVAYNIIDSISGENLVGVVAFHQEAQMVSPLQPLGPNREFIKDKISRMRFDFAGTQIHKGLLAAKQMTEQVSGPRQIIIITDGLPGGNNDGARAVEASRQFGAEGITIYPIAIIGDQQQTGEGLLRQLASNSDGLYLQPLETENLEVEFGSSSDDEFTPGRIGFVTRSYPHPITAGTQNIRTILSSHNQVIPKTNARTLVSTTDGEAALVTWRYGLGRVVTFTGFMGAQSPGTFLSPPDSRLLARTVSYVIGDPEKKQPDNIRVEDTRLGEQARVVATGRLPTDMPITFRSVSDTLHVAHITPNQTGVQEAFGSTFAVSYPVELQYMAPNPQLDDLVEATGGKDFRTQTLRQLREAVEDSARTYEPQQVDLHWLFILAAVIVFIIFIAVRKIEEKYS